MMLDILDLMAGDSYGAQAQEPSPNRFNGSCYLRHHLTAYFTGALSSPYYSQIPQPFRATACSTRKTSPEKIRLVDLFEPYAYSITLVLQHGFERTPTSTQHAHGCSCPGLGLGAYVA